MGAKGDERQLVGARETATVLGVSVATVRRAARDGRLDAVRLGERGWLHFRRADIETLIAGRR